jgi:hypothetical protein
MSELSRQLKESIQELEQIRKIKMHTGQLQARLAIELDALSAMEKALVKEQRDVEILEKEGLTTMFRKFLGDREEKLEKEREEYLRASLRFNELYKSVELIRFELDLLSKKEKDEEAVSRRIDTLLAYREQEIIEKVPAVALELQGINNQVDKLHRYEKEVEEAISAGAQAMDYIQKTESYLINVRHMGQRDMWGGRGYGYDKAKHNAVDHAREMATRSRHALIQFGHELRDVYEDFQLQAPVEIENFGRFVDIFFDNLISDWLVQQKINASLTNVTSTRKYVESLLGQLDQQRAMIMEKLEKLEVKRKEVILGAR